MNAYDRPLVEQLLPTVWDSSFAYGMDNPTAPDPDMPRAAPDPSRSNTLFAHLADIRSGWAGAYIPTTERQALLLRYGFDLTQAEIGHHLLVSRQVVAERVAQGVGRIVAYLNG